jgi:hypothetical protein
MTSEERMQILRNGLAALYDIDRRLRARLAPPDRPDVELLRALRDLAFWTLLNMQSRLKVTTSMRPIYETPFYPMRPMRRPSSRSCSPRGPKTQRVHTGQTPVMIRRAPRCPHSIAYSLATNRENFCPLTASSGSASRMPNKPLLQTPQTLCGLLPCSSATAASMICGAAERHGR